MRTSRSTKTPFKKVGITTGDPTGIGLEVTAKALNDLGPQNNVVFFIYRDYNHQKTQPSYFKLLDQKFLRLTFHNEDSAFRFFDLMVKQKAMPKNVLFDLALSSSAAQWVLDAANACKKKNLSSLVTGPLSKTLIKKAGFNFMGHTGAFRSLFPKVKLHMGFAGANFNVLIASDHIPLEKVPRALNRKSIAEAIVSARKFKNLLNSKKKIAILGLNPHAGESGLIGTFETKFLSNLPKDIEGPLVPDAAFLKKNWSKYSVFLCLYHDQGLIPFKVVHGQDSGVHITVGLPFVRTSVDHGTAFDIYNKNLANQASMLDAITLNLKLI